MLNLSAVQHVGVVTVHTDDFAIDAFRKIRDEVMFLKKQPKSSKSLIKIITLSFLTQQVTGIAVVNRRRQVVGVIRYYSQELLSHRHRFEFLTRKILCSATDIRLVASRDELNLKLYLTCSDFIKQAQAANPIVGFFLSLA